MPKGSITCFILLLSIQFCTAPFHPQYRAIPAVNDEHLNLGFGDPFEQNEAAQMQSPTEGTQLTEELLLSDDLLHELHVGLPPVHMSQPRAVGTLLTDGDVESLSANSYHPVYTLMRSAEVDQNIADPEADQREFYSKLSQETAAAGTETESIVKDALLACGSLEHLSADSVNIEPLSPDNEMEKLLTDTSQISNPGRNMTCLGSNGSACRQSVESVRINSSLSHLQSGFFKNDFVNQTDRKPLKRNMRQKQSCSASSHPIHQGKDTDKMKFQSDPCPKHFRTSSNCQAYRQRHMNEKPYQCGICPKQFRTSSNYQAHWRVHTGEKSFQCEICSKEFRTSNGCQKHRRMHNGEKPFQCDFCQKEFSDSSNYQKHRRIHTGEKPFQCDICPKQFLTSSDYQKHRRIHTGEKPFQCDMCPKQFHTSSNYLAHRRIHTGEKRFQCEICSKKFRTSSDCQKHRRIHNGEKPFHCDFCQKKFSDSSNYQKHRRIHTGEKPFQCDICPKQFRASSNYRAHRRTHTGDRV